jgi:hypothetical protein
VRRDVPVRPLAAALPAWVAALAAALVVQAVPVRDVPELAMLAALGVALYGAALLRLRAHAPLRLVSAPELG